MGFLFLFLCLIPVSQTEEFVVNITRKLPLYPQTTSEAPFTQLINDLFENNETTSSSPVETTSLTALDDADEENMTSGTRKGRLVNGNWDMRELAQRFHGSPVFASGFQPTLPPPETIITATEGISIPAVMQSDVDTHAGNFEDRILDPFHSVSNIFTKDSLRKGPEVGEPSLMYLTSVPPTQQTQNLEMKLNLDSNQMALAQAAVQAVAHSLLGQVGAGQQLTPAAIEQFQMQNSQVVTENSLWNQNQDLNDKFFNAGLDASPLLDVNPPSMPPPTIFRDLATDTGNKRYGGVQEPYHKYHDLTYSYYAPQPPHHYHHPKPYHNERYDHSEPHHDDKNILGDVKDFITDLKRNVVGTAHRFGEKLARIAKSPKSIIPAATTLLVGGLALKLLTSQGSRNNFGNNSSPLFTFGRRKRSDYFMSDSVKGKPALVRRKRRALKRGMNLVLEFQPEKQRINKRDVARTNGSSNGSSSVSSRTDRALDGTFTQDELNSLVTRLDPVQKQFLQKLQWYGFDRWKEMPCAKFILCDVIVHSDYQHVFDLKRRIGLFLSLMDDNSARKVEVMIKDLVLAIESRDCSSFFCPHENMHALLSVMPPIHPLPPPPVAVPYPMWSNHLPPSYQHPYAFPKSSSSSDST